MNIDFFLANFNKLLDIINQIHLNKTLIYKKLFNYYNPI